MYQCFDSYSTFGAYVLEIHRGEQSYHLEEEEEISGFFKPGSEFFKIRKTGRVGIIFVLSFGERISGDYMD